MNFRTVYTHKEQNEDLWSKTLEDAKKLVETPDEDDCTHMAVILSKQDIPICFYIGPEQPWQYIH